MNRSNDCKGPLLIFLVFLSIGVSMAQQLPKALILTGNGNVPVPKENYPPWVHEFHNAKVIEILRDIATIDTTSDLTMLNGRSLSQYDLIISNSIFLTPTTHQLEALHKFVDDGKALLTLHSGILSFMNYPKYETLMGGIFIGGPSTEPETFPVVTENSEFWGYPFAFRNPPRHPVSRVVADFTIKDELYYFQPNKADFHVIARAENHPVMWWHPVGRGRVMSLTLGHSSEAKSNKGYQQLLRSGVQWLLGYPLICDIKLRPLSTRRKNYTKYIDLKELIDEGLVKSFRISNRTHATGLVDAMAQPDGNIDVSLKGGAGADSISIYVLGKNGRSTEKTISINVVEDGSGNIASYYGNTATCSSSDGRESVSDPNHVIDGDKTTVWSSAFVDKASLEIDLQKNYRMGRVVIRWEDAFATMYTIEVSEKRNDWRTVVDVAHGDGGVDELRFQPVNARYVRLVGKMRAMPRYGYSLYELEIYEK